MCGAGCSRLEYLTGLVRVIWSKYAGNGWNALGGEFCVICTLLGPEGPGRHGSVGLVSWAVASPEPVGSCGGERYRPYVENYTVDASIFRNTHESVVFHGLRRIFTPLGVGLART